MNDPPKMVHRSTDRQIVPAELAHWIGDNQYSRLLKTYENEPVRKYIRTAYRKSAIIGDGGTVDVRRFEKATGLNLGRAGNNHEQKVRELINQLDKTLKTDLTNIDRKYLTSELQKLKEL